MKVKWKATSYGRKNIKIDDFEEILFIFNFFWKKSFIL